MLGISGGDPSFRNDDGSANPDVAAALADFAAARGSEHAVMTALAVSRLLVPVVAVVADESAPAKIRPAQRGPAQAGPAQAGGPARAGGARPDAGESALEAAGPLRPAGPSEKASDMAMPTLIGLDGRSAIPAFTCLGSLTRWQSDARPVPVPARAVWQTARANDSAVVIDVAGPVPFAIEGARLAALAGGAEPPLPCSDPDVREIVAAVLANQLDVASFELEPGGEDHDLAIVLSLTSQAQARFGEHDLAELGGAVVQDVMARLGVRLRRGVAIWLGPPADSL